MASEEWKEVKREKYKKKRESSVPDQEEEDQERLQSTLASQTAKDQDIVPSQDQCTIEKLILQVPDKLTPTEERRDETPPLPCSSLLLIV